MKEQSIIVYSQPGCPPCSFVKELLSSQSLSFIEKDIKKDPAARKELIEKYKAMSTPVVLIGDQVLYSSDIGKLLEVIESSKKKDTY
ncbi:glutaredoxin family protein [Bacillus salacetis]|uniref:Glutaredoxin family protein n=1 Tax=Bacillus salacetis TaxID=2315464 RepID=A0A3A1QQZ8_9BACI|nr:glutaredoxin family protein [Bacillus salacetis]RIW29509.1 glutaredoxin family protein [Bacillus salacetis]